MPTPGPAARYRFTNVGTGVDAEVYHPLTIMPPRYAQRATKRRAYMAPTAKAVQLDGWNRQAERLVFTHAPFETAAMAVAKQMR
ncbi:MAG: hypothetical protein P4L80_00855 [Xanthobacteraceae bacterium]|nr:hypothetical protein [Xanthobacteraceae bacterium]